MSSGPESTTSTKEFAGQSADVGPTNQPLAAESNGFVAADDADVLILESLEHAEERNAEILAEIVVYETSGDANLMQPAENGDGAYRLIVTEPKDEDVASGNASQSPAAAACDASARLSIFHGARRSRAVSRMVIGALVLVLGLIAAAFYQQRIKAAAETHRTLAAVAARIWSRHAAIKSQPAAPNATSKLAPTEQPQALVNSTATVQSSGSPLAQLNDGTAVVEVQPRDTLRQICLRYLGCYDTRLLNKIRELNPRLTDANHVIVGQRIVIPASAAAGASTACGVR
jgi:hypothetical protein